MNAADPSCNIYYKHSIDINSEQQLFLKILIQFSCLLSIVDIID